MANKRKGHAPRPRKKRQKLEEQGGDGDDDSLAGGDSGSELSLVNDELGDEDDDIAAAAEGGAIAVVGTYDGGLLGFRVADGAQTFGFAPHIGCVKTVHCGTTGKLASGATDGYVRMFDLGNSKEVGDLQEHDGTVSCLEFWGSQSLVTGGDDGLVCVWRCGDWELLHKFNAHKGSAVLCLAVHPSGRLMASAGRDRSLRLWDLTRGTAAANLLVEEDPVEVLQWSPGGGDSIAALSQSSLRVVNARSSASAVHEAGKRAGLGDVIFLSLSRLVVGNGRGELQVFELRKNQTELAPVCTLAPAEGSRSRVKAMARGGSAGDVECSTFVVGMSSGMVDVWSVTGSGSSESDFARVRQVDTKSRLTCLYVWPGREASRPVADESAAAATKVSAASGRAGGRRKRKAAAA